MTRNDIGQGETAPEVMWVLFDMDNGDFMTRRYLWWFKSREKARKYKAHLLKQKYAARLAGPFRYKVKQ